MSNNTILLGVNVDHSATLRQARYKDDPESTLAEPSVLQFALLSESAGADGITTVSYTHLTLPTMLPV